ncbi:hypothetical protein A9Q86_06660 [Flavobacteriales bacterium 33_180_T64]|nr:hypothetical protein A9Q86_06660 [Flavobacteriales bacterium 33_180_T64]
MKTTFKLTKILAFALILIGFACSNNDDDVENAGISVQDLILNFDENPTINNIVGNIQATSNTPLSFSITSQTPSGALSINPSTGELTVANAFAFDFETNPIINAVISISDSNTSTTSNATINLNNLDDIASFLTTSEAAYVAAEDGNWIAVTEAEYNTLALRLNNVSKDATSDSEYNSEIITTFSSTNFTLASDNGHNIPNASYVFAFKYNAQAAGTINNKVLISDDTVSGTFSQLGNVLPSSTTEDQFYVLKGNNNLTNATGYLGFYNSTEMGIKIIDNTGNYAYGNLEVMDLPSYFTEAYFLYQSLSTTQKQW